MILQMFPRMTKAELEAELAAMDRGFAKLMARPDGARRLMREIGVLPEKRVRAKAKPRASKGRRA